MIDNGYKNNKLKETIVFDEDTRLEINPEKQKEQTIVSIEARLQDNENNSNTKGNKKKPSHKWVIATLSVVASVLFCCVVYCGWWLYNYYYNIGVPVSVSTKENIVKLQRHWNKTDKPEIVAWCS